MGVGRLRDVRLPCTSYTAKPPSGHVCGGKTHAFLPKKVLSTWPVGSRLAAIADLAPRRSRNSSCDRTFRPSEIVVSVLLGGCAKRMRVRSLISIRHTGTECQVLLDRGGRRREALQDRRAERSAAGLGLARASAARGRLRFFQLFDLEELHGGDRLDPEGPDTRCRCGGWKSKIGLAPFWLMH